MSTETYCKSTIPDVAIIDRLKSADFPETGKISGVSLKYIRSGIPVIIITVDGSDFQAYAEKIKSGELNEIEGLRKASYSPHEIKLILDIKNRDEMFHCLVRPHYVTDPGKNYDIGNRSSGANLRLSIDDLVYNPKTQSWDGSQDVMADLVNEKIRLLSVETPGAAESLQLCSLAAMLDFEIPAELIERCRKNFFREDAVKIEKSVLKKQFQKLITGARPSRGILYLDSMGMLNWFLPELAACKGLDQNRYHKYDIFFHSLYSCDAVKGPDLILGFAALFHDLGKVKTRKVKPNGEASFHNHELVSARLAITILERFGFESWIIHRVRFLVRNHMFHYTSEWTDKAVRRFINRINLSKLEEPIHLRVADREGSGRRTELPRAIYELKRHIKKVRDDEARLKVRDLMVNGHILMDMGMDPGPQMGRLLNDLLEKVAACALPNEREALALAAREWLRNSISKTEYRARQDSIKEISKAGIN